jgi:hypothetical protein
VVVRCRRSLSGTGQPEYRAREQDDEERPPQVLGASPSRPPPPDFMAAPRRNFGAVPQHLRNSIDLSEGGIQRCAHTPGPHTSKGLGFRVQKGRPLVLQLMAASRHDFSAVP